MSHRSRTSLLFLSALATPLGCLPTEPAGGDGADVPAFRGNVGSESTSAPSGLAGATSTGTGLGGAAANEAAPIIGGIANNAGAPGTGNNAAVNPAPVNPEQAPDTEVNAGPASAGCGVSQGIPADAGVANTIVRFPPAYDGSTPFPLVFAFHGAGRTNEDMRLVDSRTEGSELEANYVVAFMKSQGNGWDIGADYPRFEAALEQILAERCIDTESLFAFGHSSGAQFIAQMLGNPSTLETRFAGVVPVASSRMNNPSWTPVPTLVIHGLNDNQRGGDESGALDVIQYTASNQCSGGTAPVNVPSCASLAGGVPVNAGCVEYSGCAATTLFCNHDDPNYLMNDQPTNHGWPCFANSQIFQFFESLR